LSSLLVSQRHVELPPLPAFARWQERIARLREFQFGDSLSPPVAEQLFGRELKTSITSLQRFAECPFKFFVHAGLRAKERQLFQVDSKKLGDFQHRILKAFHDELKAEGKRWREITPAAARQRIARLTEEHARTYYHGLFAASAGQRFAIRQLSLALQDFIEVIVGWMRSYQFEPAAAELRFAADGDIPPWRLELEDGRALVFEGSVDRVDLAHRSDGTAFCVVLDFKSSARDIDAQKLHNGIQIQLPAYLSVLRHLQSPEQTFGAASLAPAGLFYVSLRGNREREDNRQSAMGDPDAARRACYQHCGRFDETALPMLDAFGESDQFDYTLNQDGTINRRSKDPMTSANFLALLDGVETRLREFGKRIFSGEATVAPYRKNAETACKFCDYRPVCRIDPWTHRYRALERLPKT
jgi:ATP-dependent helicase/nuclease subunit B